MKKLLLLSVPILFLAVSCSTTPPPDYSQQLSDISTQLNKLNEKPGEKDINDQFVGYQAVFLTNGQVYFGKLSEFNQQYMLLTDVYYLQTSGGPLQGITPGNVNNLTQPQISLVKLGNEIHGPEDAMYLDHSNILFFENLKADGQVVRAIMQNKNSGQ